MPSDQRWAEWCETFDAPSPIPHAAPHTLDVACDHLTDGRRGTRTGWTKSRLYFERTYVMTACIGVAREGHDARTPAALLGVWRPSRKTPAIATRASLMQHGNTWRRRDQDVDEVIPTRRSTGSRPMAVRQPLDRGIPTRSGQGSPAGAPPVEDFVDKVLFHRDRIAPRGHHALLVGGQPHDGLDRRDADAPVRTPSPHAATGAGDAAPRPRIRADVSKALRVLNEFEEPAWLPKV